MSTPDYALSPHVSFYLREKGVIQCGIDATRVGVIEGNIELAQALNAVRQPVPRADIEATLIRHGIEPAAARSIVDDFIAYHVLWPAPSPATVVVLGASPLADALCETLRADGCVVRTPLGGESDFAYLVEAAGSAPIIAVDLLHRAVELAGALAQRRATWLPVSMCDARGVIGPLLVGGRGPCPLCAHLHRIDADENWHGVVDQVSLAPAPGEALIRGAVVAQAVVMVRRLLGRPVPPGAPQHSPIAGELLEVDLYGHNQRRFVMEHQRCPHCA